MLCCVCIPLWPTPTAPCPLLRPADGKIAAFLEERVNVGVNFILSAELDHAKKDYKFGFGESRLCNQAVCWPGGLTYVGCGQQARQWREAWCMGLGLVSPGEEQEQAGSVAPTSAAPCPLPVCRHDHRCVDGTEIAC